MKRVFVALMVVFVGVLGVLSVAQPAMAAKCPAGSKHQNEDYGPGLPISSIAQCNIESTTNNLTTTVNTIINVVLGVIGLAAVVMIIVGGISFVTSQGDAAKASKAKNTILYSVVGLIVALLAFAIVNFVLSGVFG